jgi:hypothetical protein
MKEQENKNYSTKIYFFKSSSSLKRLPLLLDFKNTNSSMLINECKLCNVDQSISEKSKNNKIKYTHLKFDIIR